MAESGAINVGVYEEVLGDWTGALSALQEDDANYLMTYEAPSGSPSVAVYAQLGYYFALGRADGVEVRLKFITSNGVGFTLQLSKEDGTLVGDAKGASGGSGTHDNWYGSSTDLWGCTQDELDEVTRIRVTAVSGYLDSVAWANLSWMQFNAHYSPVTVAVTSPNGGEEWRIGESYYIKWSEEYGDTVTIALYKGGVLDSTIVSGLTASNELYLWTIPDTVASGFDYKIRVTESGSSVYDESDADFTIAEEGTTETAIGCFLLGDDWDSPENITADDGSVARAIEALKALVATCFSSSLKAAIPEGSTFKGFWGRVKGTVYWDTEPDELDLIVRFKDNEGYVGKTLTFGKNTYWCPTCGWTWRGNPGAVCPQCGEATESHPLWTTGGGSGQTFDYVFGGTDFAAVTEGAGAYILPPSRCVITDAGFGIEFEVQSSDTVGIDMAEMREGFELSTSTLTIGIDYVTVMAFYEE